MRDQTPLIVLWRRKWIVIMTFLVAVVTTVVVSRNLEDVYSTEASLLVALPSDAQSFDAVQASQTVARSYADIIDSPNFASLVAERLADGTTASSLESAVSVEATAETQLLTITAEDGSPTQAAAIADAYAEVFIDYAERRLEETTTATVSVADEAPVPSEPARPQPALYTFVGGLLGLALGAAAAFLRDRLDRRLRSAEDVESAFDRSVLTRVPKRGRSQVAIEAFHEAYRVLKTNLPFASPDRPVRSVLVTSGSDGEGKTTTTAELAIASAERDQQVIVVEGDFRRPQLQKQLIAEKGPIVPGLSNHLVGNVPIERVIYPTDRPNVRIVPAGPLPPVPSALFDSRTGREAVFQLLEHADLVIIDSPPLSIGADASVLSGWADGVILVVDLSSATDRSVDNALHQLDTVQAPLLGLLLNRDRGAEVSHYEYYMPKPPQGPAARMAARLRLRPHGGRRRADSNGGGKPAVGSGGNGLAERERSDQLA